MARTSTGVLLFGGALVAVWGVELTKDIFGWLVTPMDVLIPGPSADYAEYVSFWMVFRGFVAAIGVLSGILVLTRHRLGHWLSMASAVLLLLFATNFHWYASLASGQLGSSFVSFFFVVPGLAYGVIVLPIIVGAFLAISAAVL